MREEGDLLAARAEQNGEQCLTLGLLAGNETLEQGLEVLENPRLSFVEAHHRTFLTRHGVAARAGDIVDEGGRTLGAHDGFWRFTPGQRKGLGVVAAEPLYVLDANPTENTVRVGPRASLARRHVSASGRLYVDVDRADAKLRYRSPAVSARVVPAPGGFELELDEPTYGVARGQAAVLYDGDAVVGCGLVSSGHDN